MTRRAVATVLLALVVVLAGCGGGDPTPTETPTATVHPFADGPPGIDETGVTDVDALMAAHNASLDGQSVTVDLGFHLTVNGSGEEVSLHAKVVPDSDRGWIRFESGDDHGTYYTEGTTTYYREVVDANARYGTIADTLAIPETGTPRFGTDDRIRTALESADWEPVGTVERDGRTLYELEATDVEVPGVNASDGTTVEASGRLLVDRDGVIHHLEVDTTVEDAEETVQYGLRVSLSDIGSTSVDRPDWYDNAAGS